MRKQPPKYSKTGVIPAAQAPYYAKASQGKQYERGLCEAHQFSFRVIKGQNSPMIVPLPHHFRYTPMAHTHKMAPAEPFDNSIVSPLSNRKATTFDRRLQDRIELFARDY